MCSTRAAPAWFEWSELFKLFDWVEFFSKIIFRANGEKNNLKKFNEIKKFKKQAQLLNQAGAALVLHIKWWRALFFRCLNLASKKDGAFDILLLRCWFYLLRILNNACESFLVALLLKFEQGLQILLNAYWPCTWTPRTVPVYISLIRRLFACLSNNTTILVVVRSLLFCGDF